MIKFNGMVIQQQVKLSFTSFIFLQIVFFLLIVEKTTRKALAGVTLEEQINAIHRSQGLLADDTFAANRIGPAIPKPITTSTHSSTAKTIQKPPQLSSLATKPFVTIATSAQRTMVGTPIMQRPGMQPVTILPQATHTMVAMPSVMTVQQQATIHPPPSMEEPASKRSKTEDQLIPEEEFYKTYGKVRIIYLIFQLNIFCFL